MITITLQATIEEWEGLGPLINNSIDSFSGVDGRDVYMITCPKEYFDSRIELWEDVYHTAANRTEAAKYACGIDENERFRKVKLNVTKELATLIRMFFPNVLLEVLATE